MHEEAVLAKLIRSRSNLGKIALKRIRAWPGCRGAARIALTLDDEGEWSFDVSDAGSADAETVRRAAIAVGHKIVGHKIHDEFDLATNHLATG
jgi:hypothetical protein